MTQAQGGSERSGTTCVPAIAVWSFLAVGPGRAESLTYGRRTRIGFVNIPDILDILSPSPELRHCPWTPWVLLWKRRP